MTTWTVPGVVTRVIDGDTVVATLDLGWNLLLHDRRIRLAGLNCPEMSTPEGPPAREFTLAQLLSLQPPGAVLSAPVTVVSHSLDKYGRVLGTVYVAPGDSLNDRIIAAGHAVVMR